MKRDIIIQIMSGLIALVFVYAAISKLIIYDTFKTQLSQSPFISSFSAPLSWILPFVEIVVACSLGFSALRLYALYTSLFLLSVFTAYLTGMVNFSYYIPCSCGGLLASLTWKQHIALNGALIVITIGCIHLSQAGADSKQLTIKM